MDTGHSSEDRETVLARAELHLKEVKFCFHRPRHAADSHNTSSLLSVPRKVVARSHVLHLAFLEDENIQNVDLRLPEGVLWTWLQYVLASDRNSAKSFAAAARNLVAADFLGDKEGVQALCTEAAQLIYSTPTECIPTKGRPKKTRKSAQKESAKRTSPECPGEITQETSAALEELPTNLLEAVITASPLHLSHHLQNLPEAFHSAAVNAVCPNINTEGKFILQDSDCFGSSLSVNFWDRLWPRIAQHTHLHHLEVTNAGPQAVKSLLPYLDCFPALRNVNFASNGLRDDDVLGLASHMDELTALEHLNLSGNEFQAFGCEPVIFLIIRAVNLTSLDLSGNDSCPSATDNINVGGQLRYPFEAYLSHLSSLQHLNLSDGSVYVAPLARQFRYLTSLESLDLSQNWVHELGVEVLASHLCYVTLLTSVNLSGMRIDKPASLASHISCLVKLERLDLADNGMNSGCLALFDASSMSSLTALRELFLERTGVIGSSFAVLARTVQYLPSLRRLALTDNSVGRVEIEQWQTSLRTLERLTSLNLCQNRIRSDALHLLCSQLHWLTDLKRLILRLNSFDSDAFVDSAVHFSTLTSIEHLSLSVNHVGNAGLQALVPSLHSLGNLTYLGLSDIEISDSGAIVLSHTLLYLQKLKELHIGNRDVGLKGVKALVKSFKELPCMKRVYVGDARDSQASVSEYNAAARGLTRVEFYEQDPEQTPKQGGWRCECGYVHPYHVELTEATR